MYFYVKSIFRGALLLSWGGGGNLIKGGEMPPSLNKGLLSVRGAIVISAPGTHTDTPSGAISSREKRELCHGGIGVGKVQLKGASAGEGCFHSLT